jgi:hypothetical protein
LYIQTEYLSNTIHGCFHRIGRRFSFVYQITLEGTRDFVEDGVRCLPASDFLGALV